MTNERNPLLGAAVLKRTLQRRGASQMALHEIYEGTLRDLGLRDADVEAYLRDHEDEVEARLPAGVRRATPTTKS